MAKQPKLTWCQHPSVSPSPVVRVFNTELSKTHLLSRWLFRHGPCIEGNLSNGRNLGLKMMFLSNQWSPRRRNSYIFCHMLLLTFLHVWMSFSYCNKLCKFHLNHTLSCLITFCWCWPVYRTTIVKDETSDLVTGSYCILAGGRNIYPSYWMYMGSMMLSRQKHTQQNH